MMFARNDHNGVNQQAQLRHLANDGRVVVAPTSRARGRSSVNRILASVGVATTLMILGRTVSVLKPSHRLRQLSISFAATVPAEPENKDGQDLHNKPYEPAWVERFVVENANALGYNTTGKANSKGCTIWQNESASPIFHELKNYSLELSAYYKAIAAFQPVPDDLRNFFTLDSTNKKSVCEKAQIHPDGLLAIFKSGQLSLSSSGYMEPLLPPMRHPDFCIGSGRRRRLMDLTYLVHDFSAMCRKLKKTSRTVFVDMGASLSFHGKSASPALDVIDLYRKFGIYFDHIYAYEIKATSTQAVFDMLPKHLIPAFHWINLGVSPEPGHFLNPLEMLLQHFNKDDLIIVKLDVDTNWVELPLAKQLLEDDRFLHLVDQFYFEHHVHLHELAGSWGASMEGSVADSLHLFYRLRERGIPAHFWP